MHMCLGTLQRLTRQFGMLLEGIEADETQIYTIPLWARIGHWRLSQGFFLALDQVLDLKTNSISAT